MGIKVDFAKVQIEPLFDSSMASLSIDEFMQNLEKMDASLAKRVDDAARQGK
jgi:hypothetical protein